MWKVFTPSGGTVDPVKIWKDFVEKNKEEVINIAVIREAFSKNFQITDFVETMFRKPGIWANRVRQMRCHCSPSALQRARSAPTAVPVPPRRQMHSHCSLRALRSAECTPTAAPAPSAPSAPFLSPFPLPLPFPPFPFLPPPSAAASASTGGGGAGGAW